MKVFYSCVSSDCGNPTRRVLKTRLSSRVTLNFFSDRATAFLSRVARDGHLDRPGAR